MAISHLIFTHAPTVPTDDCATVNVTDLNGNPTTPDGIISWAETDGGAGVGLTYTASSVTACAIAVGTYTVTCTAYENGAVVTGAATVTVTSSGGKLSCAWSSGTGLTIL